jgi:uncharacterized protein (TIGR02246 family)
MHSRIRLVVLLAALTAAGCSGGARSQEFGKADAEAIRAVIQDFVSAYNAKDAAKLMSHFAGNAVLMPPNASTLRGPDSIKGYFETRFNVDGATDLTIDPKDISGHGPLAYVSGDFSLALKPAGGQERRDRGKLLWILRNLSGRWLYEYTIWSSDLPPPAPAPAS